MTYSALTPATGHRPQIGYCQKHASARFRLVVPADRHRSWRFCTSGPVDYDPSPGSASDGSINRYYDPTTAQFLTRDPLVAATNQPYTYANDNPLNETDPSGLCGCISENNLALAIAFADITVLVFATAFLFTLGGLIS